MDKLRTVALGDRREAAAHRPGVVVRSQHHGDPTAGQLAAQRAMSDLPSDETTAGTGRERDCAQLIRERAEQIAAQAPPLTAEQRERLSALLRPCAPGSNRREPAA